MHALIILLMFEPSGIITITTDFGAADGYSGVMEAVVISRFKYGRIVRITDSIPPHDVRAGAWVLMNSCPYFPEGTVHIAVVDPGVGTDRKIIVALAGGHLFVAPDNGLVSFVLKRLLLKEARVLENMSFSLSEISGTFHGRDIIAPAAAALAYGKMRFEEVGRLTEIETIGFPECSRREKEIEGEVIYRDLFGNLIT
ncbi:MAG: SAM-dependent chlorinase/fluorinase, partial [Deltaproteobacteria bacterium]|nr:SAM-dependent chlorinase/fluorinase [Deltaproteobacteria bacterium]